MCVCERERERERERKTKLLSDFIKRILIPILMYAITVTIMVQ